MGRCHTTNRDRQAEEHATGRLFPSRSAAGPREGCGRQKRGGESGEQVADDQGRCTLQCEVEKPRPGGLDEQLVGMTGVMVNPGQGGEHTDTGNGAGQLGDLPVRCLVMPLSYVVDEDVQKAAGDERLKKGEPCPLHGGHFDFGQRKSPDRSGCDKPQNPGGRAEAIPRADERPDRHADGEPVERDGDRQFDSFSRGAPVGQDHTIEKRVDSEGEKAEQESQTMRLPGSARQTLQGDRSEQPGQRHHHDPAPGDGHELGKDESEDDPPDGDQGETIECGADTGMVAKASVDHRPDPEHQ